MDQGILVRLPAFPFLPPAVLDAIMEPGKENIPEFPKSWRNPEEAHQ